MSRLIDADELLLYIDRVKNSGLGKQKTIEYLTKYIINMKTAFDVDEAIKELEKLQEKANNFYYLDNESIIKADTYEKAIDIVNQGKMNE